MSDILKECQMCHQSFPIDQFYRRKDRNGKYTWKVSYCRPCVMKLVKKTKKNDLQKYKEYNRCQADKYYHNNTDKIKIIQKRYYYRKLPFEKQIKYKQKLQENFPEWVDKICR